MLRSLACLGLLVLSASIGMAADRNGGVILTFDEISKVMEKLPPLITSVSGPDLVNWSCSDVDLREHCSDLDGCTVNLHMQHKIDPNDMVRGIKEYLYFENAMTSNQKGRGLNGYTRQSAGGEHGWITGTAGLYTLFAPWGWVGGYNYRPGFCPGQNGRNSAAHANPYLVTVASHPHVNAIVVTED